MTEIAPISINDSSSTPPPPVWLINLWNQRPFGVIREWLIMNHNILTAPGYHLIATNLNTGEEHDLGFIAADDLPGESTELTDITIPDGDYEIEARASANFWSDARAGNAANYRLQAGQPPQRQLPGIIDLRAGLTPDFWRVLDWGVASENGGTAYDIGI